MSPHQKVAIAHDYLTQRGGAERVVLAISSALGAPPIYTTLYDPGATFPEFADLDVRPSPLNRVVPFRRHHRAALPLLPWAASRSRIDADVVVASSSGFAHGFPTSGAKVVYCYTPPRFLYQPDVYLGDGRRWGKAALIALGPALRAWDRRAAETADVYLAISTVTQERIRRVYGREAAIVPPPLSDALFRIAPRRPDVLPTSFGRGDFILTVSRLLPYKNVEAVVQAAGERPDRQLVVVGAGPLAERLENVRTPNVVLLRGLADSEMRWLYENCQGLVAASHEDFGLTPLEAAAFGRPSAVLRAGGYLDTMTDGTAVFFKAPTPAAIGAALDELGRRSWDSGAIRARAAQFSEEQFSHRIRAAVDPHLTNRGTEHS